MAKNDDLSAQAGLEQSINDAIASRAGLLKQMNAEMSAQLQMQLELCAACEAGPDYAGKTEELGGMTEALRGAGDAALEGAGGADKMSQALGKAGKSGGKAGKSFMKMGAVVGMFAGIASAAKKVQAVVSAMTGGLSTAVSFIQKTATGVFSGLSNTMGWLASQAQAGSGGAMAIGKAYEELKDTVGGAGDEFNAAHAAIDNLQSGSATAAMSGINLATIYGKNSGGVAAAIADVGKIMGEAGEQAQYLTELMEKNTGAMLLANKALGLSGQTLAAFGKNASLTGADVGEFTDKINLQTAYMSKKFGINVKQMGKKIGEMTKDFSTFGTMTPKELATTAAYADKLGISIKGLQGITAKTDDFEGAAMAAAELAGSFGMTIDAMDLMTADPAEKAEMVRKAFQETGKDFATMSRQEKARMAEITGMKADELAGMFDPANADIGLDDMEKAADEAANGAITQQEATEELTKSIKKLIETSGGLTKSKGPFDAMLNGFTAGIMKSAEMRKIFSNLRKTMRIMYNLGKQLGQAFIDLFPGVKDLLGGVADLFDPERYGTFAASISKALAIFRKTKDIKTFIDSIKTAFTAFFGSGGEAMKKIKEGAKKIVLGIVNGLALLLPMAIGALTSMVSGITKWLLEPKEEVEEGAKEGFGTAIWNAIKGLGAALKPALGDLASAVGTLLKTLWTEKKDTIISVGKAALVGMFGALFMGGVGGALKGALIGKMSGSIKDKLGKTIQKGTGEVFADSSKGLSKLGANMGDDAAKMGGKMFSKLGGVLGKVGGPLAVAGVALSMSEMRDKLGSEFDASTTESEQKAGMMAAGIVSFLTMGLVPDDILIKIGTMTADVMSALQKFADDIGLGGVFKTQMDIIGGVFDTLAGLGDVLMGVFTGDSDKVAEGFKSMVSGLTDIMIGLPTQIWEWAKLLLPALGKAGLWLIGVTFKWFAMYLPKAVWTLIVGIGKALKDGLIGLKDMVVTAFMGIWKFITDDEFAACMKDKIMTAASDMLSGLIDGLSGAVTYIKEWAGELMKEFFDFWGIASDSSVMADAGTSLVGGIMSTLSGLPQKFLDMANEAWDFIVGVFDKATDIGGDIIDGILTGLGDVTALLSAPFTSAWSGIKGVVGIASPSAEGEEAGGSIVDGMLDGLNALPQDMLNKADEALDAILGAFGMEALKPIIDNVWNTFTEIGQTMVDLITEQGDNLISLITTPFTTAWDTVKALFTEGPTEALDTLVTGIQTQFDNIIGIIKTGATMIKTWIMWPFTALMDLFPEIPKTIKKMISDVKLKVTTFASFIWEHLEEAFDKVKEIFDPLITIFTDAFEYLRTFMPDTVNEILDEVIGFIDEQVDAIYDKLIKPFKDAFNELGDDIFTAKGFQTLLTTAVDGIKDIAGTILTTITKPFTDVWGSIKGELSWERMEWMGGQMVDGILAGLANLAGSVGALGEAAWDAITGVFETESPSKKMKELGGHLTEGLGQGTDLEGTLKTQAEDGLKSLETGLGAKSGGDLAAAALSPVAIAIEQVLQAQNNIHEILNKLAPIDLDATISRTAEELAVKNKTVQIQHKPVKITVNLNVTMVAEDVATALVEGKYVAQGDNFTPPGQ